MPTRQSRGTAPLGWRCCAVASFPGWPASIPTPARRAAASRGCRKFPAEARPLIQHLVEQRLLATDVNKDTGEATIEPAHEALLRQWGLLEGWLTEDAGLLAVLEGVKRASRDWAANNRSSRLARARRPIGLAAAERLSARPDLAANLDPTDRAYIAACRKAETDAKRGSGCCRSRFTHRLAGRHRRPRRLDQSGRSSRSSGAGGP